MGGHADDSPGREEAAQSRRSADSDGDQVREGGAAAPAGAGQGEAGGEGTTGREAAAGARGEGAAEANGGADGAADAEGGEGAADSAADLYALLVAEHEKLRQEHEALQRQYEDMRNTCLRLQAEFDNFRRRTREEDARRRQEALEAVIRDLLPIVDNMERAVQAAAAPASDNPDGAASSAEVKGGSAPSGSSAASSSSAAAQADEGIREGVALIFQQLRNLLESRGVTPAPGVGEPFDPQWHHAVGTVQAPGSQGGEEGDQDGGGDDELVVIEEFQKGYVLGGRAIRPSLVTVGPRSALPQGSDTRKGNER